MEIEGLQYQIDLFESLSREEQENFLISILQDVSQYEEWMDKMVQIWKSGDSKGMEKLLMESVDEFPESKDIYKKLLDERNKKMAERIQEYLSTDDKYFIVVGAAHLVGNKGIIQLLKDKGYRVEQVISLN